MVAKELAEEVELVCHQYTAATSQATSVASEMYFSKADLYQMYYEYLSSYLELG